eukprot:Rmarinus@m.16062
MASIGRAALVFGTGVGASSIYYQPEALKSIYPPLYDSFVNAKRGVSSNDLDRQFEELRRLISKQDQTSVVVVPSSQNTSSYLFYTIGAGGIIAGYLYWRGYTWQDVAYVSKSAFTAAVQQLENGIEVVSVAVERTKEELRRRIDEVSEDLKRRLGQVSDSVEATRDEVATVASDVAVVQNSLTRLENTVGDFHDQTQSKLDYTGRGIYLLVRFISENMRQGSTPSLWNELVEFVGLRNPQAEVGNGAPVPSSSPAVGTNSAPFLLRRTSSASSVASLVGDKAVRGNSSVSERPRPTAPSSIPGCISSRIAKTQSAQPEVPALV